MLLHDLYQDDFKLYDEKQWSLIEKIKEYRAKFGKPQLMQISKALTRTRPYTRTVYPKNWNAQQTR